MRPEPMPELGCLPDVVGNVISIEHIHARFIDKVKTLSENPFPFVVLIRYLSNRKPHAATSGRTLRLSDFSLLTSHALPGPYDLFAISDGTFYELRYQQQVTVPNARTGDTTS